MYHISSFSSYTIVMLDELITIHFNAAVSHCSVIEDVYASTEKSIDPTLNPRMFVVSRKHAPTPSFTNVIT